MFSRIFTAFKFIIVVMLLFNEISLAQSKPYEGPDDPAGDVSAIRKGRMNGNRVLVPFFNTTELGDYPKDHVTWPNDENGLWMHDNMALMIGAKIYLANDTIPVTDPAEIASRTDLENLYYIETHYRGETEKNAEGTVDWGFYPVPGYFNENSEYPAMSNLPESWPVNGWPSRGSSTKWPGEWNGRFGRGIAYADLECYFVANDAQDEEYLGPDDRLKYYPRPGLNIGDKNPGVTIQKGMPWGGIGVRVEVRGLQWNNPQARDAIFFEYNIANISDFDLPAMAFGYYIDTGVGGEDPDNDMGHFDKKIDMAYVWDYDGIGLGGLTPGTMGIAFLESPGISNDGIDNDEDGLTDEKRDNKATKIVGPYDGITNLADFLDSYNKQESDLREHWDADEDQDWMDGNDANGDGKYSDGESAGDDVGTDGVGPYDLNYNGPDADGTECNHKPDFTEGLGSEPNFGPTDITESDMLGLTMFDINFFGIPRYSLKEDENLWNLMTNDSLKEYFGEITNIALRFASATFPLHKGRTERISMSELHSYEELSGLNSAEHSAPSLFQKKKVVQIIYESDYRFARPPEMPSLNATAADGKVILTWDDAAEKYTREPLLKGKNDFEGYKIYKSTDKRFSDAEKIYDGYGNPIGKKPIFQCDLKDTIQGFADYGEINGLEYNLGTNSGLTHYFVDNNVQNGRTYYYAIVAYDYGIQLIDIDITPSENNVVVDLDENDNIRNVGRNVQIVTPHQPAAGFVPPSIDYLTDQSTIKEQYIQPNMMDIDGAKAGHTYKIKFETGTVANLRTVSLFRHPYDRLFTTTGYSVYDVTGGDTLIYRESPERYNASNLIFDNADKYWHFNTDKPVVSDVVDGVQLSINLPRLTPEFDPGNSGWVVGNAPIDVIPSVEEAKYFPWQYDIIFTGDSLYTGKTNSYSKIVAADNTALGPADVILGQSFNFKVVNKTLTDSDGVHETLDLMAYDVNHDGQFNYKDDEVLVGYTVEAARKFNWAGTIFDISFRNISDQSNMPKENDVYRVDFKRPFFEGDSVMYTIKPSVAVNESKLKDDMEAIKVVPNPYVATNAMEPEIKNPYLNQRRRLLFTHIPANSTIKIFTSSGVFVDEIKVDNPPSNGAVTWDMLTSEGLEIAAGIYLYQVESNITGKKKLGKFAVIK